MYANLNSEQREAVLSLIGPVLLLAGPGSGKTHTIIEKIKYMIEEKGISPREILVITFSKKAASEMQDRFIRLVNPNFYPVYFGTFHAIYYSIIKEYYGFDANSVLTEKTKKIYLNTVINSIKKLREKNRSSESMNKSNSFDLLNPADEIISKISLYKCMSENKKTEFIETGFKSEEEAALFVKIYDEYVKKCRKNKKLDFDDMLYLCRDALKTDNKLLNKYQNIYKYILIDEFQDINDIQYEVLRLLSEKCISVFAVGDDDQSIYGFRGSRPKLMQRFIEDNPMCKVIDMNKNYRCAECVIDNAGKLISNNVNRIKKSQISCKKDKENGSVTIVSFQNSLLEAEYVIDNIKRIQRNSPNESIAVLYRTEKCADFLNEKLKVSGIKCSRKNETSSIYNSEWVKDILAYLRIAAGDTNTDLLLRIINRPHRELDRDTVLTILKENDIKSLDRCDYLDDLSLKNTISLFEDINRLSEMNCYAALIYIFKKIKYENYLNKTLKGQGYDEKYIADTVNELLSLAKHFISIRDFIEYIDTLDDNTENKLEKNNQEDDSFVTMMTAHSSKGLEFDTVFIIGLQEGIFPHRKAITEELIEEERRLLYVAMTRAKKNLYVIGRGEEKHGKRISQFIYELKS